MSILSLRDVVKRYGDYLAVNHVSFDVSEGTIFGLLGPNGAGKTSLIRIITSITGADSGSVLFNGQPLNSLHPNEIGYMPEERGLYKKMKVGEQLMYLAQLKGMGRDDAKKSIIHWLEKFEITSWWQKKVSDLSKGMSQKVQFIATVVHNPKLLILDEPFSGLDPINANLIKDEIFTLKNNGASILFSTHRMEQVEEICNEIVLINQGKNILSGQVKDIKNNYKENIYQFVLRDDNFMESDHLGFNIVEKRANNILVKLHEGFSSLDLLRYMVNKNIDVQAFNEVLPSINEIFIKKVSQNNE